VADLPRTVYPHKWSPVSCRSSAGQRKFAGQRPTFYRCATQPTTGRAYAQHRAAKADSQLSTGGGRLARTGTTSGDVRVSTTSSSSKSHMASGTNRTLYRQLIPGATWFESVGNRPFDRHTGTRLLTINTHFSDELQYTISQR